MPISVPAVPSVPARGNYDAPKTDVHLHDYSASVRPEPRDTVLRDKRLAQYADKDEQGSLVGQFDDADPVETGVRFSSQAGILRGAGHGGVP